MAYFDLGSRKTGLLVALWLLSLSAFADVRPQGAVETPAAIGGDTYADLTPEGAYQIARQLAADTEEESPQFQAVIALYRQAAEQGHPDAQQKLGWLYSMGDAVEEDEVQAAFWLEKAAQQGNANAQYNLAWRYMNGDGVEKNTATGRHWFGMAAAQGHVDAQNVLGYLLSHGDGASRDVVGAAHWFSEAARKNHMLAKGNLADLIRDRPQINIEGVVVVRGEPNTDSAVVTQTKSGESAYTLESNKEWTAVLLTDRKQVGWIKTSEM